MGGLEDYFRETVEYLIKIRIYLVALFVMVLSLILSDYIPLEKASLVVIITSASIINAIVIGFLFDAYFKIKQFQLGKLSKFCEIQNELVPYQQVFGRLVDQILRKNKEIKLYLDRPYTELRRDVNFWKNQDAYAIDFLRALYEVSQVKIPDFEETGTIIRQENLEIMYEAITEANALLTRKKYYKHIFPILGFKVTEDFDKIIIADSSLGMESLVKPLIKKPSDNWKTLEFWYEKIIEATNILSRMKGISVFVYHFVPKDIRELSLVLIFSLVCGVIVPLVTISLPDKSLPIYLI